MRLSFGDCSFDQETREVHREGRPVHLSPKAFELLHILIHRRPTALSKEDLQERLWPDTYVVEANLSNLVGELRAALGDETRASRYIRTVPRFGYAFCAEVTEHARPATAGHEGVFRAIWQTNRVTLGEGEHLIGRDPDAAIRIVSTSVSRRHARIRIAGGAATIEDLGSKNGTFVGATRIVAATALADGDEIRAGAIPIAFRAVRLAESTETEAPR